MRITGKQNAWRLNVLTKLERQEKEFEEAYKKAVLVKNDVELRTAIGKKELIIISEDPILYERLLNKMPKERVVAGTKKAGSLLATLGVAISVLSYGLLSFVGVPMVIAGSALGAAGCVLDDYKEYSLFLNYDKQNVIFFKIKGDPKLKLPSKSKKLIR